MQKLVRDRIPEIIRQQGKVPKTRIADKKEYWSFLKEKLVEEVNEFLKDETTEELADILEVIYSICKFKNWDLEEIEKIRIKKRKERGGFEKGVILIENEGL